LGYRHAGIATNQIDHRWLSMIVFDLAHPSVIALLANTLAFQLRCGATHWATICPVSFLRVNSAQAERQCQGKRHSCERIDISHFFSFNDKAEMFDCR
jgi:hypothetical protein